MKKFKYVGKIIAGIIVLLVVLQCCGVPVMQDDIYCMTCQCPVYDKHGGHARCTNWGHAWCTATYVFGICVGKGPIWYR